MAFALLTHTQKDAALSPITTTAIDTTGATIIVVQLSTAQTGTNFSDSQSNRWVQVYPTASAGAQFSAMVFCVNPITSASHTFTLSAGSFPSMAVVCFSGTLGALVSTQAKTANPATTITFPSITPSANGALWVAGFCGGQNKTLAIDSGFTMIENAGGTNGQKVGLAYLIQGTAGALTPTFTYGISDAIAGQELVMLSSSGGGGGSSGISRSRVVNR